MTIFLLYLCGSLVYGSMNFTVSAVCTYIKSHMNYLILELLPEVSMLVGVYGTHSYLETLRNCLICTFHKSKVIYYNASNTYLVTCKAHLQNSATIMAT